MEHTITVKRQSQSWATGDDDHWVKTYPRYYSDGELIEDLPAWAMCMATDGVCKELSRQLIELFRQSPRNYHITDGHFKVLLETLHIHHRIRVDLTLVVSDEEALGAHA